MAMFQAWLPCSAADEDVFGPTIHDSCHHGFDFTLLFEEMILTLLPIILAWLAAPIRAWNLRHASEKANRSWLYAAKEVCQASILPKGAH